MAASARRRLQPAETIRIGPGGKRQQDKESETREALQGVDGVSSLKYVAGVSSLLNLNESYQSSPFHGYQDIAEKRLVCIINTSFGRDAGPAGLCWLHPSTRNSWHPPGMRMARRPGVVALEPFAIFAVSVFARQSQSPASPMRDFPLRG